MDAALLTVSLALATALGFSAHRASICTVKATAEVLSTGRAYMFLSFGRTVLWVLAITLPMIWLVPSLHAPVNGWALSPMALAGGFAFGMGAALNGGCAFSTLTRLCDGKLNMLAALAGFAAGAALFLALAAEKLIPEPTREPVLADPRAPAALVLAVGLVAWGLWEVVRLLRTQPVEVYWTARIRSHRYRLSTAAAVIGLSNGVLYLLYGSWAYTGILQEWVRGIEGIGIVPGAVLWALFAAVLLGMFASSYERGSFRIEWRPTRSWLLNLAGGLLMGFGAAAAPGGNDVLILHQVPILSPHALPVYGAIIAGIAAVLMTMRLLRGEHMTVRCSGDICSS